MKTRIITGIFLIPLLVGVLCLPVSFMAIAVSLVCIFGIYEFFRATALSDKKPLCAICYAVTALIPIYAWGGCPYLNTPWAFYAMLYLFGIAVFSVMLACREKISVKDAGLAAFGVLYIPAFLSCIVLTRLLENGEYFVWLPFIGAFCTDTFAYFSGVFFGKHKLCPQISPKKTIEGSVGGTAGCILIVLLFGILLESLFDVDTSPARLAVLGLLIAIVSQLGDLTASIIKRTFGIKDYGNLFPGHGGILDRLDSVIAVSPLVFFFIKLFGV